MHNYFRPFLLSAAIFVMSTSFFACKSPHNLTQNSEPKPSEKIRYSVTYMIHGDADYLYHDSLGSARQADEKVLEEAKRFARNAENGEVFIFHQRPERKILWLFPRKDRQFFYFKQGELVHKTTYSPSSPAEVFAAEAGLYRHHKSLGSPDSQNVFLYFGHEIPYTDGSGYYHSLPELQLNTDTFAQGLSSMLPGSDDAFDLTVLSTCNNGSPDMVQALQPYSRILLASPQNLHLSHIDTEQLSLLEKNPSLSSKELAEALAKQSYERLSTSIQTVISLTIYDLEIISGYIHKISSAYNEYLSGKDVLETGTDNVSCTSLSIFPSEINFSKGVTNRYRPPKFGRQAKNQTHSGWGCKEPSGL